MFNTKKHTKTPLYFLTLIGFFYAAPTWAQDVNADSLMQTQNLLRSSTERQKALTTEEARAADRNAGITALGNGANKDEIYSIAADLMPWLLEQSQGDPAKMSQLMQQFQQNPRAFFDRVPASQRARISALADRIERERAASKSGQTRNP